MQSSKALSAIARSRSMTAQHLGAKEMYEPRRSVVAVPSITETEHVGILLRDEPPPSQLMASERMAAIHPSRPLSLRAGNGSPCRKRDFRGYLIVALNRSLQNTIPLLSRLGCSDPNESDRSCGIPVLNRPTLTLPLEPISVSSLLCAIAADCHAAPPARMTAGSIDEEKRTGRSLASFHVGEVLCADEVRQ